MPAPARRTIWLRVVAGFALLASLVVNFGIIDLLTAVAPSPEWEPVRMLEAGWGIVFGILLPIGFAAQFRRGGRPVATVQQLVVVTASLALATILTLRAHEWLLVLFWAAMTAAIVALHPARSRAFALPHRADPALAGLAAPAVVPALGDRRRRQPRRLRHRMGHRHTRLEPRQWSGRSRNARRTLRRSSDR